MVCGSEIEGVGGICDKGPAHLKAQGNGRQRQHCLTEVHQYQLSQNPATLSAREKFSVEGLLSREGAGLSQVVIAQTVPISNLVFGVLTECLRPLLLG